MRITDRFLTLAAAAAVCLPSCDGIDNGGAGNEEPVRIELTKSEVEVAERGAGFGIGLFSDIASNSAGNVMISPFSASLCLSMIASGADGETYAQMAGTLGFEGLSSEQIGSYYRTVVNGLRNADKSTKLAVADAVWAAKGLSLRNEYVSEVQRYYDATAGSLDFSKKSSVTTINKWCSDNTNGMIREILDDVDPDIRVVIANALYFKGIWSGGGFHTQKMDFTDISGNRAETKFFYGQESGTFSYFGKDASVISLPYGNGAFSMVFVLPPKGTAFKDFVGSLTVGQWNGWYRNLIDREVEFHIPTFKSEFKMSDDFKAALGRLGMVLPFGGSADFSRMCASESLFISDIIQKTFIDVNEKGTEAAAVTAGMMKCTSAGPSKTEYFIADRPFVYAIVERSTGTILFMGTHVK